jgi:hypothetical protein
MRLTGSSYAFFDNEFELTSDYNISKKDYKINETLYTELNMFGDILYIPRNGKDYMETWKVFKLNKRERKG